MEKHLAGHTVRVFLNQEFLGRIKLDAFGAGELSIRSDKDEMVPAVQVGDVVRVRLGQLMVAGGAFGDED